MRNIVFLLFILMICAMALDSVNVSIINAGLEKEELKGQIIGLETKIQKASLKEKGALEVQLAKLLYQDQNRDKAFATFLLALADTPITNKASILPEEEFLYQKALELYLNHHCGHEVQIAAETLLKEYEPIVQNHPEYIHLNYLIAAAYANRGDFLKFFDYFYRSFCEAGSHYLADRSRAILHIMLYEKTAAQDEKEKQRQQLQVFLSKALEKYPRDVTLYKLKIVFAKDEDRTKELEASLLKILSENMIAPRTDVLFYVTEALKAQQKDLAQKVVLKAREWYPSSRLLNSAQEMIDQGSFSKNPDEIGIK